jgi:signal recognition particle subunit SRP54
MRSILEMVPGIGKQIKDIDLDENEKQMNKMEVIITSMTKKERQKPEIINPARKRRIAAGSGTRVEDVNRVLKQFEQARKMMKQMGSMSKMKKRPFMPF